MEASLTLSSINGSSKNITENSTLNEQEKLHQLEHALTVMNLIESRLTFVKAKLKEGVHQRRNSVTQTCMDITHISKNSKTKLDELWSAVENLQIKTAGLKAIVFNIIGLQLLSSQNQDNQQLSVFGIRELSENILTTASRLAVVSDEQKRLYELQENESIVYIERQDHFIELMADVNQKIEQLDSFAQYNERYKKTKERIANIKIARAIINGLLSNGDINFEENPDLLELKEKWRPQRSK
ncbi:uncharacterized protein LOC124360364 isoform X2 [Homalodisca vitripennis]|nr:uncharacterized protein LOC124360364 isoform X2 [Homalodisca vitripennis]